MTANKEQQVVVVSEFEVGRVDGVYADARIIVSEGLCHASEGKPDSTRFAHVSFRKFVHLVRLW